MTPHRDFENIRILSGQQPNNCACSTCANMCRRQPCLGTPADILALINAGHVDKVELVYWAAGLHVEVPIIHMVQLSRNEDDNCIIFENGLCKLHDSGLKPTEGKLVTCKDAGKIKPARSHVTVLTAKTWMLNSNTPIIAEIAEKMILHEKQTNDEST